MILLAILALAAGSRLRSGTAAGREHAGEVTKFPRTQEGRKTRRKVIVLGFDGADPALCERWMAERDPRTGRPVLEHLARLKAQGSFARLKTTLPAQTPVAWATAACSANPGVTSIADFVTRDPKTMAPDLTLVKVESKRVGYSKRVRRLLGLLAGLLSAPFWAFLLGLLRRGRGGLSSGVKWKAGLALGLLAGLGLGHALSQWIPERMPTVVNRRQGTPLWDITGAAGVRTRMLKFPLTFPAEHAPGLTMLAGFGVPDVTGWPYSWTLLDAAARAESQTETLGTIKPFTRRGGVWTGFLDGPENPLASDAPIQVPVELDTSSRQCRVGGAPPQALSPGAWSEPFPLSLRFSPLLRLRAFVRAYWSNKGQAAARPQLLLGPLQFDPRALPPNVPLSTPLSYAPELARKHGLFPTVGWAVATHPAKDGKLADAGFIRDVQYTFRRDSALFEGELARNDWDLFMAVFMETDRASHILWKHLSKRHPFHDPKRAPRGVAALRDIYRTMDRLVGRAMARAKELDADLLVISDHGFAAFDYQVNLNSVLRDAGLLKLRAESLPAAATQVRSGENLLRIDFPRTQAYALGLGGIYLNMKGRERYGVVTEEERGLVTRLVVGALKKLTDPQTGRPIVRRVVRNEDLYHGPYADRLPDLLVCFERGFRVSWATAVGGAPKARIEPNNSNWSGDHCSVDPDLVPGILFSKRPLPERKSGQAGPALMDLAPTVAALFGIQVPPGAAWEGRPWWAQGERKFSRRP